MSGLFVPNTTQPPQPLSPVIGEELSADFLLTPGKGYSLNFDPTSDVAVTHSVAGIALTLPTMQFTLPWTAVMPFDKNLTVFEPKTLTGDVTFVVGPNPPIPGSMVIYRLTGDGATVPKIDPSVVQIAGTLPYSKGLGVVNTLQVWWDGGGHYYQWIRGVLPDGTGLASIGLTFPIKNSNFTTPTPNTYSSLATAPVSSFSGSAGSAQAIPATKNGQVTFLLGAGTLVGLNDINTVLAAPNAAPAWRYYLWDAGGTLFTGESGTANASTVTGVTAPRYIQIRRVGSIVSAWHKLALADPWLPVANFAVAFTGALFVMLGTTAGQTATVISLEVEP